MTQPKLALCNFIPDVGQLRQTALDHGFSGVDWTFSLEDLPASDSEESRLRRRIARLEPLEVRYHCAFNGIDLGDTDIQKANAAQSIFRKACRLVSGLEGKFMTVHLGLGRESYDQLCWERSVGSLADLVDFAEDLGIRVCLENLASGWSSRPELFDTILRSSLNYYIVNPLLRRGLPMPKKTKISIEVLELAMEAAQKAKTADDLRMAQAVLIPGLLDVPDRVAGQMLGRSRGTVVQLRKKFGASKRSQARNWGGRRYGYLTIQQERDFLSRFLKQAAQGAIVVVSEIHQAFEALVGHKVAQTTIYRMLDRHNWRTIIPRPRHQESNTKAQEGFKKTPQNGG